MACYHAAEPKAEAHTSKSSVDKKGASYPASQVYPLTVTDDWGVERRGLIARLDSFEEASLATLTTGGPDFLIALLSSPGDAHPTAPGTVVCEPAHALADIGAVREDRADLRRPQYGAPDLLTPEEIDLFERGRFFAADAVALTPSEVFSDRRTDFPRLARELFRSLQQNELLEGLAQALCAPALVTDARRKGVFRDLRRLVKSAEQSSDRFSEAAGIAASDALGRVRSLSTSRKPETLVVAAPRQYARPADAMKDVFVLRAMVDCPDIFPDVIDMREFVEASGAGANESLGIDGKLVEEQLQFAALVPEPRLFSTARAPSTTSADVTSTSMRSNILSTGPE